jgi:hypothetical protein
VHEGWYLMSAAELETELARWRHPERGTPPTGAVRLTIADALAYRNAGNLPDSDGRSLRLVLHVDDARELSYLQEKRLEYEPDFHEAPSWRREGSKAVNVVPLRREGIVGAASGAAWWDDPDIAALEKEWSVSGLVEGLPVPAELRGFVYKTVLSLRAAGRPVTPDSIADSVSRWLPPDQAEHIRSALRAE